MSIKKVCPNCGTHNDPSFVSCKRCGTSIDNVDAHEIDDAGNVTSAVFKAVNANSGNFVANIIKTLAIITYVGAFLIGLIMGRFSIVVCWSAGFVSGSMLLGFSEIIRLLDEISKKK